MITIARNRNLSYNVLKDGVKVGEIFSYQNSARFGLNLTGFYWYTQCRLSTTGGMVNIGTKRRKDAVLIAAAILDPMTIEDPAEYGFLPVSILPPQVKGGVLMILDGKVDYVTESFDHTSATRQFVGRNLGTYSLSDIQYWRPLK